MIGLEVVTAIKVFLIDQEVVTEIEIGLEVVTEIVIGLEVVTKIVIGLEVVNAKEGHTS